MCPFRSINAKKKKLHKIVFILYKIKTEKSSILHDYQVHLSFNPPPKKKKCNAALEKKRKSTY